MSGQPYAMDQCHKDCLRRNRQYLVENVLYDDVRDYLVQESIITSDKDEQFSSKTTQGRMRELMNFLPICGPRAYGIFLKALKSSERNYDYVLDRLDRTLRGENPNLEEPQSLRFPIQEGQSELPVPPSNDTSLSSATSPGTQDVSPSQRPISSPSDCRGTRGQGLIHSSSATVVYDKYHESMHHSPSSPEMARTEGGVGSDMDLGSPYSLSSVQYTELQSDGDGPSGLPKWTPKSATFDTSLMSSININEKPYNFLDDLTKEQQKTRPEEKLFGALAPHVPSIDVLGVILGFSRVKLDQFKNNNPHLVSSQAIDMFSSWRSSQYKNATIKRIVRAYQKADLPLECYRKPILDYFNEESDSDVNTDDSV